MKHVWAHFNNSNAEGRLCRSLDIHENKVKQNVCNLGAIKNLTFRDLLTVSQFEQFLMLWLKNADGMYDGQALAMSIDDQFISAKESFGRSIKGRRDQKNRAVLSLPDSKESLIYYATSAYTQAVELGQECLPEEQRNKMFPNFIFEFYRFLKTGDKAVSGVGKYLLLLNDPKSHLSSFLSSELGDQYLKPFQWLLNSSIKAKKNIQAAMIRNSAIVSQEVQRMSGKVPKDNLDIESEASGHSVITRLNVYMSRTKSREVATEVQSMERRAIELMEQDALEILNQFENIKDGGVDIITHEALEELRRQQKYKDINRSHSKLYQAFEAEENSDGMHYSNNRLIFVESRESVAFMLTQIHLKLAKAEQNAFNLKYNLNQSLLTDVVVMRYVMEKKFTTKIVKEGEAYFAEHIKPTLGN